METMGERLRRLRISAGLTQEEVGKSIGVQKAAINKYENGDVENIKRASVLKLANLYGVRPSYILCFDDVVEETSHSSDMTLDTNETWLINSYRELSDQGKEYILQTMNMALNTYKKDNSLPDVETEVS